MNDPVQENAKTAQEFVRGVVDLCVDCDHCRTQMDEGCAFFPELYRLWDQHEEAGTAIPDPDLRRLADLCTFCGLCPCPRIPVELVSAKSAYIEKEGLPLAAGLMNDVPRLARTCGTFPRLVDALQSNRTVRSVLRKLIQVHPERRLPRFQDQDFFKWAREHGLEARKEGAANVAYFAGCTAGHLFPRIGRAVVAVLQRNGLSPYVPKQDCCGMPFLMAGDRKATLRRVRTNMDALLAVVRAGDRIIGSCPTCGFFMKVALKERAYYSEAYQRSVQAGEDEIKVPQPRHGKRPHGVLKKILYKRIMKDDGYFSAIDPMDRIALADQFYDVGEYLALLHQEGRLDTRFLPVPARMVFFASCHQREQRMGRTYLDILRLIPGLTVEVVGDTDCCGMGGNFGFRDDFHEKSLTIARPLLDKIRAKDPEAVICDCLSCKMQFNHALPYPVHHPLEILVRAYGLEDSI
jgi:glycerol-3-phosphate dehydrogenase subunit C